MQPDFSRPVLAIDTATAHLSLALRAGGSLFARHTEAGSRQSALILPQIAELFAEAGVSAADLAAVVYAQGPGAFTGLRIGLGVAQGLAAPFATPLIGVPCLDAAAFLVRGRGVLAAADARMGEVLCLVRYRKPSPPLALLRRQSGRHRPARGRRIHPRQRQRLRPERAAALSRLVRHAHGGRLSGLGANGRLPRLRRRRRVIVIRA